MIKKIRLLLLVAIVPLILNGQTLIPVAQPSIIFIDNAATITFIASTTGKSSATNTTTTTTVNCTGANFAAVGINYPGSATGVNVTDNQGNSYSLIRSDNNLATDAIWTSYLNTVSSSMTFTITTTSILSYNSIYAGCFSGVGVIDKQNGNITSANSISTGAVTPSVNGELIFTVANMYNLAPAATISGGCTLIGSNILGANYYAGGAAWVIQPTASTINLTWSTTSASIAPLSTTIATFKPQ